MRKIRGGKNKEKDRLINIVELVKDNWLMYTLVFFFSLMGVLIALLLGKYSSNFLLLLGSIYFGLVSAGLLISWVINQKTSTMERVFKQDDLHKQYNAFALLIGELEYNLQQEEPNAFCDNIWQQLRFELSYFPSHLYEEIDSTYRKIEILKNTNVNYRELVNNELNLSALVSKLRDWQYKIRKRLFFV